LRDRKTKEFLVSGIPPFNSPLPFAQNKDKLMFIEENAYQKTNDGKNIF
jgi:hypothetical protein